MPLQHKLPCRHVLQIKTLKKIFFHGTHQTKGVLKQFILLTCQH